MDAQIGTNRIKKNVFSQICKAIRQHKFETGGIIGISKQGEICDFRFDKIVIPAKYEYLPNVQYLTEIINGIWKENNISFIGFVHSHLHNDMISQQDISYAREILRANDSLDYILIGVINLENEKNYVRWNRIETSDCYEIKLSVI